MNQYMKIPQAKRIEKKLIAHNDIRLDPYYWLNERENPATIKYLEEENQYLDHFLNAEKQLREELFEEMKGRIMPTDLSVPYFKNGYWYKSRYEEGQEYQIFSRSPNDEANYTDFLNVNHLAEKHSFYSLGSLSISPNNKLLLYSEDTLGRRIYTLKVMDLSTGKLLEDTLSNTDGYGVWDQNSNALYYTTKDETLRSYRVYQHILGQPQAMDKLVFEESDDTFSVYIKKSRSEKYIFIISESTLSSEVLLLSAYAENPDPISFHSRKRNFEYQLEHFNEEFWVLHNNNALNFQLSKTNTINSAPETWTMIIEHKDDSLLEDFELFEGFVAVQERANANAQISVLPLNSTIEAHSIVFNDEAYLAGISYNPEAKSKKFRLTYSSMTTPSSVYEYDPVNRKLELLKRETVLGDFQPEDYRSEKKYITSYDGTMVPISIVYHKDTQLDGTAPLLLYGYGSYGYSMEAYFSSARLSLLNRGFVYVIAHIRGGQELGRQWYENGKLLKKENTFLDFIAAGKYLVENNYCSPKKLNAMGGSAGGLLIGAVVNKSPELFNAVIAAVPFVDVVTTMLDDTIPLTTGEYDEWGNPNVKEFYDYMKSYSPYDNVKELNYPAILATTGFHDSQVQYWEPAKWVAKLRDFNKSDKPILLFTDMNTGHGGASGRYNRLKSVALEYAFLIKMSK